MRLTHKARLLGHTAALALMLPGLAAAQTADTLLDPIVIEGESGTGPVGGAANPNTQAGAKTATPVTEVPQSVSVVGSEEIRAGNIGKLDQALGYVAGVQAAPYGYDSDTNWFFVRGFAATADGAFQDGLQHYSYGFGGFYIDPFLIERIDVLKGPASVLYGGSNPGGIINYVSKVPGDTPRGEYEIGADENGRFWSSVDTTRIANGTPYRFVAKAERVDGNGAFEHGFHGVIAPSVKLNFGATDVTLLASYTRVDEDHVGGSWLPYVGTVTPASYGYIDRDFNTSDPTVDWYERDQIMLSSIVEHDFGNGWNLTNTTRFGWSDIDESAPYAFGNASETSLSRLLFQHQTETLTFLNDTRVETTVQTGGVEHRLLAGVDLKYFRLDQQQASGFPVPDLSIIDPVYGVPFPPVAAPYIDNTITQTQLGLYAQDQIRWGDGWIGTANLRYDWVDTEAKGLPEYARNEGRLSGRLGIARELANGVTPYASYATFFNPKVGTLATGDAQKNETGEQYEVGVKWAPEGSNFLLTAAAFDLTRENVVQTFMFTDTQFGEVRSRGVEFEAKGEIAAGLTLTAAYTDMDVEAEEAPSAAWVGKTPWSTIEKTVSVKLDYDVAAVDGLNVWGGVRYLGSSWADNENTLKVPSQTLVDAGASYAFGDGWQANLAVSNLTDETYVAACQGTANCYYGDGRRASLAIRKSF